MIAYQRTTQYGQQQISLGEGEETMCGAEGPVWDEEGNGPTVEELNSWLQHKGFFLPDEHLLMRRTVPPFTKEDEAQGPTNDPEID